jgi:hypothetical protein
VDNYYLDLGMRRVDLSIPSPVAGLRGAGDRRRTGDSNRISAKLRGSARTIVPRSMRELVLSATTIPLRRREKCSGIAQIIAACMCSGHRGCA